MKKKYLVILSILIFSCSSDEEGIEPEIETSESEKVFVLPIVVHIIHAGETQGEGYNLSQERIISQIELLNNDFRRKKGSRGYNNHELGADTKIEFKLAEIDPNGLQTNGINRININDVILENPDDTVVPFDWLPEYSYWSPEKYINIWVTPGLQDLFLGSATGAHSDLPGLEEEVTTKGVGVLVNTLHFGESNIESNHNLGRTLTHEMGHFLGLFHLWGYDESNDCMKYDDYVKDTPPVAKRNTSCNDEKLACNGEFILTNNYMDYVPDHCMNMFTKGQVERMSYVLEHSLDRIPLTESPVISRD